jgi:hypothetical protein
LITPIVHKAQDRKSAIPQITYRKARNSAAHLTLSRLPDTLGEPTGRVSFLINWGSWELYESTTSR